MQHLLSENVLSLSETLHSRHSDKKKAPQSANWLRGFPLSEWAWVELNLRPHAYQAASYEHEFGSEVLTSPPFRTSCSACRAFKNILRTSTNILRMRMDTTTDTILSAAVSSHQSSGHRRGSLLRPMRD